LASLCFGTLSVEIINESVLAKLLKIKGYFSPEMSSCVFITDIAANRIFATRSYCCQINKATCDT
jgi:hypothetical protein